MDETMLYESKAISKEKWETQKTLYTDWEYKEIGGTIYLRKHISGEISIDKGWTNVT